MPHSIGRERVQELVEQDNAQLVEVLPEEEYAWAHIPGAVNLPLRQLEQRLDELDRSRPVVLYCNDFL
jgi:rhodanese-related sulfurtransferase